MKKIISIFLVIVMTFGIFSVCASAVYYRDDFPNTHKNTGQNLADLIAVAKTQIGYTELSTKTGKPLSPGQDGGYTKYGAWFGAPTVAWCAYFVAWCSNQAGISTSVIPRIGNCANMVRWYTQRGKYFSSKNFTPRTGDLIFYNWSGGATAKHIGIVTGVSSDYVYTVEGNTGAGNGYRAEAKARKRYASYIIGYARPAYNDASTYVGSYSFASYAASKYKTYSKGGTAVAAGAYTKTSQLAVVTGTAADISANGAVLIGRVDNSSSHSVSSAGFYFGSDKNNLKRHKISSGGKGLISLKGDTSKFFGSLTANTTYYYCSYAVIKGQTYKGPVYNFTTADDRPQLLVLSATDISIAEGETYDIFSALLPLDSRDDGINWQSDNELVAAADSGTVKGLSVGRTDITASSVYGDVSAVCAVTVTLPEVQNINAQNISETEVKITWDKNTSSECCGYEIYKSDSPDGEYTKIGETGSGTISFADKELLPNERRYYKIKSIGISSEFDSDLSEKARIKAVLPSPQNLFAVQDGLEINLSWSKTENAESYNIYRSVVPDGGYTVIGTTESLSFKDTDLRADTTYYYKVSAQSDETQSNLSKEASVKTGKVQKQNDLCDEIFGENKSTIKKAERKSFLPAIPFVC